MISGPKGPIFEEVKVDAKQWEQVGRIMGIRCPFCVERHNLRQDSREGDTTWFTCRHCDGEFAVKDKK